MEHTWKYWKTVYHDLRLESKTHPTFVFIVLALLTIPMGYAVNGIAVALLVLASLVTFSKRNSNLNWTIFLPIGLFVLMSASMFWTVDTTSSAKALQKGLPLLLVPISFLIAPDYSNEQKRKIIRLFSIGMVLFTLFWLVKALVRFVATSDTSVFFYHELVTQDVNAIHVSVYIAVAISYFLTEISRSIASKIALLLLCIFLVLLSSKNIIVIFFLIVVVYAFRQLKTRNKSQLLFFGLLFLGLGALVFVGKIKQRIDAEFQTAHSINHELSNESGNVYNVSAAQAWQQEKFSANEYFPGTAFRIYQIRIFKEMLLEDPIFFTGYGVNAVDSRIKEKGIELGVYTGEGGKEGYTDKNFHNEYIQLFAEVGIFGLLILVAMLAINFKNGIKTKDFVHISFAILMISLFLTESFLSRQRGIVFFSIMYCLFNSRPAVIAPK